MSYVITILVSSVLTAIPSVLLVIGYGKPLCVFAVAKERQTRARPTKKNLTKSYHFSAMSFTHSHLLFISFFLSFHKYKDTLKEEEEEEDTRRKRRSKIEINREKCSNLTVINKFVFLFYVCTEFK